MSSKVIGVGSRISLSRKPSTIVHVAESSKKIFSVHARSECLRCVFEEGGVEGGVLGAAATTISINH
jgi:hypothetical protein